MAEPKKPPKGTGTDGYGGGGTVDTGDTPAPKPTAAEKKLKQKAKALAENYMENNRGGAPVNPEFVLAALQQGLTPNDVRAILNSQALGGPQTSAAYSSEELLDYFTENPEEIASLRQAVVDSANAPESYAEYLAGGGAPGGYRSRNMVLQESVLGIGGARQAYLAGSTRQRWIDEGNDPNQWHNHLYNVMQGDQKQASGPSFQGGFDAPEFDARTAAAQMIAARQQRAAALQGPTFDLGEE